MWRPWVKKKPDPKTKTNTNTNEPSKSKPKSVFRCSSFKDIHHLTPTPTPTPTPILHRARTTTSLLHQWTPPPPPPSTITVYYTTLHVIRPTFDACRTTLSILRSLRVPLDERDVTMDPSFSSDLRNKLGPTITSSSSSSLPRVFLGRRYIGGADEILRLNEIGELKKMVEGMPHVAPGTCATCGGFRFVLCGECSGSHKIFSIKTGGMRLCTCCNHNGLIRCPTCFSASPDRPILPHPTIC